MKRTGKLILTVFVFVISLTLFSCAQSPVHTYQYKTWDEAGWKVVEESNKHRYHFQQLSDGQKENYARLADGLRAFDEKIYLEADDTKSLYKTYNAFINDNPDVFWITAFDFAQVSDDDILVTVEQPDNVKEVYQEMQVKADQILANMPTGSEYDKVKYLYEYVVLNTDYDLNAVNNQDIRSVLLTHKSVCTGYAKTFQFLAEKAGIETIFMVGRIEGVSDYGHAWNMVKIGDHYYWVDPTWGDPVFEQTFDLPDANLLTDISYRFLCVPDVYFSKTHQVEKGVTIQLGFVDTLTEKDVWVYPEATDNSLNYTFLNGGYFESYDANAIENYLHNVLADQNVRKIEFQFANDEVYQQAKEQLIVNNGLGDILGRQLLRLAGQDYQFYTIEEPTTSSFSLILP